MTEEKENKKGFLVFFGKLIFALCLIACAILTASALVISYPKFNVSYAVWIAFIPFTFIITRLKRDSSALFFGWLTGFLFYLGFLYWIIPTCQMGGLTKELSIGCLIITAVSLSFQFAIFGLLSKYLTKLGRFFPLWCAFAWVVLEWGHIAISYMFTGFPWFVLGYSQWQNTNIIQISSISGVFGVSFIIVLVSVSIGYLLAQNDKYKGKTLALVGALLLLGLLQINGVQQADKKTSSSENDKIKIALIQPNINQYKKWDTTQRAYIKKTLRQMSEKAVLDYQPDLIVWPESSIPGHINQPELKDWVSNLAKRTNTNFFIGAMEKIDSKQYVSAHLISNFGIISNGYYKQVLVPFGEYVPFEKILQKAFPDVEVLGFLGGFSRGLHDQEPFTINNIAFGPSVCFEALFPQVYRGFDNKGARFFINITNDSWYLDTAAPYQHFTTSVFRAIETNKPVLRLSNNGISTLISPKGLVQKSTLLNTQDTLFVELLVPKKQTQTIYSKYGDVFALMCFVLFALGLLGVLVFKRD